MTYQAPLGPGHVPTWMTEFKSSTSTAFRKALSKTLASLEDALEWSGRPEEAPPWPGCRLLPCWLKLQRLDCTLGHVPHPLHLSS